jgi:hypothetical protein
LRAGGDGAFHQPAWRLHSRLRGLYDDGLITEAELRAAAQWERWTEQTAHVTSS